MDIIKIIILVFILTNLTKSHKLLTADNGRISFNCPRNLPPQLYVISIIGNARVGKSTFMNLIAERIGCSGSGFETGDTLTAVTRGVDYMICGDIMLLDVEGDDLGDESEILQLSTVVSAISGHVFYYAFNKLDNDALGKLKYISKVDIISGGLKIPLTVLLRTNLRPVNFNETLRQNIFSNYFAPIKGVYFTDSRDVAGTMKIEMVQKLKGATFCEYLRSIINKSKKPKTLNVYEQEEMRKIKKLCSSIYNKFDYTKDWHVQTVAQYLYDSCPKDMAAKYVQMARKRYQTHARAIRDAENRVREAESARDILSVIGIAAPFVLAALSDERLKTDIRPIYKFVDPEGRMIQFYEWRWNLLAELFYGLSGLSRGVIAQEIKKIKPECFIRGDYFHRVDYECIVS